MHSLGGNSASHYTAGAAVIWQFRRAGISKMAHLHVWCFSEDSWKTELSWKAEMARPFSFSMESQGLVFSSYVFFCINFDFLKILP